MPVDILIAPPASGKTHRIIQRIRQALQARPLAPVWVIVPDRLQAEALRRRLAKPGGALGARVATFSDLYRELLETAGRPTPLATTPIIHLLLRTAIDGLQAEGRLPFYAPIYHTPGLVRACAQRLVELKSALVDPPTLQSYAQKLVQDAHPAAPRLNDLAAIYERHQNSLQRLGWADQEGLGWLAVEALEAGEACLDDWQLLIFDGFDDFNRSRVRAIQSLSTCVPQIIITLTGKQGEMQRPALRRWTKALDTLTNALPEAQVEFLNGQTNLPSPLSRLQARLFDPHQPALDAHSTAADGPTAALNLLEVRSPAEEAREALRWLKAQIQGHGCSPRDCALFAHDLTPYHPHLKEAAREFGLPLAFTVGESLARTAPVAALIALLGLPIQDYPRRPMLDALRSPFFDLQDFGFEPGDPSALEAAALHARLVGGWEQWEEALQLAAAAQPRQDTAAEEDVRATTRPQGIEAERLLSALRRLAQRLQVGDMQPMSAWVDWLDQLLDQIGFREQIEPALRTGLEEVIQALVVGDWLKQTPGQAQAATLSYTEFVGRLSGLLEGGRYFPELDFRQPAILAGHIAEARGLRFKAVAVLGLAEGVFPAVERADPFLDEDTRQALQLDSALGRDQAGFFYAAITACDERLLLTRPYLAEGGEPWEASHYWSAVKDLSGATAYRPSTDAPRRLAYAASPAEGLFWAARQGLAPKSDPDLMQRYARLEHAGQVLSAQLAEHSEGPHAGFLPELAPHLAHIYGPEQIWSASRLETYAQCPHRFFVEQALDLEPRSQPEDGFDAAQLGSMLHAILEVVYRRAKNKQDLQELQQLLPEVAQEEFEQAPQRLGFRPGPLWEVQQAELQAALERTIKALDDESKAWTPFAFEERFGLNERPPLALKLESGTIYLRGLIDRLDCDEDGHLRVIDYKTGSGHLTARDLESGRRLQLPIYALAAESLELGQATEGLYWAIHKAEAGGLRLSSYTYGDQSGPQAAYTAAQEHIERALSGIHAAEFPPEPLDGQCPSYCAAASWCWRYRE